jgi:hypothetical protein
VTYRGHHSRADLGLRAPRSRSTNITPERGGCTRHYGGTKLGVTATTSHDVCRRVWKNWQNYHMDVHGWADIAYTAGYCQHGYSFAGRGLRVRTGANGTDAGNQSFYAFTFIGGEGDVPTVDALDALDWLVRNARADGAGSIFNNHSDHKATSCAGSFLRTYTLGQRAGAAPGSAPSTPTVPTLPAQLSHLLEDDDMHLIRENDGTNKGRISAVIAGVRVSLHSPEEVTVLSRYTPTGTTLAAAVTEREVTILDAILQRRDDHLARLQAGRDAAAAAAAGQVQP